MVAIVLALISVASWLAVIVADVWSTRVYWRGAAASQPAVLARTKAGHECREGCRGLPLLLAKVSDKPLVVDVMLKVL